MSVTSIEWTDVTWNPVRGCSRVSEGCRNCYAERIAMRFTKPGMRFHGFARDWDAAHLQKPPLHVGWTGKVSLIPEKLDEPLRWRKPRKVFVNSMSDLFHESLDFNDIAAVYGVMAAAPQHTFQILTKRPARRRQFHERLGSNPLFVITSALSRQRINFPRALQLSHRWPLPNVWEGVSVEDHATAGERIPHLLQTPAAVRFVSYEPALGPVDFTLFEKMFRRGGIGKAYLPRLDWIIVGGESGPGARPFGLAWARSTIEQCKAAGVACFVKQLGADPRGCLSPCDEEGQPAGGDSGCDAYEASEIARACPDAKCCLVKLSGKGGGMEEWPEDLRVREFPA